MLEGESRPDGQRRGNGSPLEKPRLSQEQQAFAVVVGRLFGEEWQAGTNSKPDSTVSPERRPRSGK
jgi:hypothetical protein